MLTAYFKIFKASDKAPDIGLDFSDYRKNKILMCKNSHDKLLEYGAALTLKSGLSAIGIKEESMRYALTENGKPFFPDAPDLHFSISHAGNMAITVFSDKNVGIDCENIQREVPENTLRRFFLPEESADYKDRPLKLWVIKESLAKLSGNGILKDSKKYNIPPFERYTMINGIRISIYEIYGHLVCIASERSEKCRFIEV